MRIVEKGHVYELDWFDGQPKGGKDRLIFVNREDTPHPGTQTQEVIRALIDRTEHCHSCIPWRGNDAIIHHLGIALALHESRALERKAEKGYYKPELIAVAEDGHFELVQV